MARAFEQYANPTGPLGAPAQTPQGQAAQGAPARNNAQPPNFSGSVLSQRSFVLQAGIPHTEYISASTMKIIASSAAGVTFRAAFDESETFDIFEGSNFAPGFQFRRVVITSPVNASIKVQFGYAYVG